MKKTINQESKPIRVYEFSKEHDVSSKDLMVLLRENGFDVQTHMSFLSPEAQTFLAKHFSLKEEHVSVKQGSVAQEKNREKSNESPKKAAAKSVLEEEVATLTAEPMTVADFAQKIKKPASEIILFLLRQKIIAPINFVLNEKLIELLAQHFGIPVVAASKQAPQEAQHLTKVFAGAQEVRLPVVVVVGHVDHGKTTLLDFIRKTRVAAKEKGGITQHLGAYEVSTKQGELVFLDTPGHEAFSLMRVRGLRVADIAILVVAADDGVMPQTVEAIQRAKAAGLPVIVALNKIDKATSQQIEAAKVGLSRYELIPEEWGGSTVIVPISAKTGQGVDDLLDVVVLQSQVMDLLTDTKAPTKGFVLESKMEKGRGPVATVICQQGLLKIGDHFNCGSTHGKITSIVNSVGKRIMQLHPSIPGLVAGFADLPNAGDLLEVVSAKSTSRSKDLSEDRVDTHLRASAHVNALPLILKTDNASSKEALLGAIDKISQKATRKFHIILAGVGPITEGDIMLAMETKSRVYGFHTSIETNASALANKENIPVILHDIIYRITEDLEALVAEEKVAKKVSKKIGEASVLKVFDIKGLGVIAGAFVKTGRFSRDGRVIVWRGKYKAGEGAIKSLQRDKKAVKEVHSGFECAFMIDGFSEWQVDDRVECYLEVDEA